MLTAIGFILVGFVSGIALTISLSLSTVKKYPAMKKVIEDEVNRQFSR